MWDQEQRCSFPRKTRDSGMSHDQSKRGNLMQLTVPLHSEEMLGIFNSSCLVDYIICLEIKSLSSFCATILKRALEDGQIIMTDLHCYKCSNLLCSHVSLLCQDKVVFGSYFSNHCSIDSCKTTLLYFHAL